MALLFCDGFDGAFSNNTAGIWDSLSRDTATISYSTAEARTTGATRDGSLKYSSSSTGYYFKLLKGLASTYTELYLGVGFFYDETSNPLQGSNRYIPLITSYDSIGERMFALQLTSTGRNLVATLGDGGDSDYWYTTTVTTYGGGSASLDPNVWHYIEAHWVVSDTVGKFECRINGKQDFSFTSKDTIPTGGAGNVATVALGGGVGISAMASGDMYFDDFIVHDTTGSINNSWVDGKGVITTYPLADGADSAWSKVGASYNADLDDLETGAPDDDTTRIYSSTSTQKASIAPHNLPVAATVGAVQLATYVKQSISGSTTYRPYVDVTGTDRTGTSSTPSTEYAWEFEVWDTNPDDSTQWEDSEYDGAEFGWEMV